MTADKGVFEVYHAMSPLLLWFVVTEKKLQLICLKKNLCELRKEKKISIFLVMSSSEIGCDVLKQKTEYEWSEISLFTVLHPQAGMN